ncbi:MAG: hypothetical protein AAFQ82_26820, partial [Myxococcota bacterium]
MTSVLEPRNDRSISRLPWVLVGAWLFLSLSQTLHFYTYYNQSLWDSARWSFRDWLVWYLLFAGVVQLVKRHPSLRRISTGVIA